MELELFLLNNNDKIMHMMVSVIIMICVYILLKKTFCNHWKCNTLQFLTFIITVSIGLLKELYDKISPNNNCEIADFVADIIGIAIGLALLIAFQIIRRNINGKMGFNRINRGSTI